MTKILLLGASGRTGRVLLNMALDQGHEIVALVRDQSKLDIQSDNLCIVEGSPANKLDIVKSIQGCDAVISTLNNNRTSDAPWAKPVSPAGFMTGAIKNCVEAMEKEGLKRIVVLSAAGVGDSFQRSPWLFRFLIRKTNLSHTYEDHNGQEEVLRSSNLKWTAVRPVGLTDKPSGKDFVADQEGLGKPSMTIYRDHVARFLLDCLDDPMTVNKTPLLYERKN